jgi:hypothetical protein
VILLKYRNKSKATTAVTTRVIIGRGLLLRLVTPVVPPLSIFNLDKSSLATGTPLIFQSGDYGAEVTLPLEIYLKDYK